MQTPFWDASVSKSTITLSYLFPSARSRLYNGKHCMKRDSLLCFVAVYCRKLNIHKCKIKWLAWQNFLHFAKVGKQNVVHWEIRDLCKNQFTSWVFILNLKIGAVPLSLWMLFIVALFAKRFTVFCEVYTTHYGTKKWRKAKHILPALELAPSYPLPV